MGCGYEFPETEAMYPEIKRGKKVKKKNHILLWTSFILIGVIYLFIWSGLAGAILAFGVKSYQAVKFHLNENTTVTIYYIFRDTIIIGLLYSIWRRK